MSLVIPDEFLQTGHISEADPTAVFDEITNVGDTDASARIVSTLSLIKPQSATDRRLSTY